MLDGELLAPPYDLTQTVPADGFALNLDGALNLASGFDAGNAVFRAGSMTVGTGVPSTASFLSVSLLLCFRKIAT